MSLIVYVFVIFTALQMEAQISGAEELEARTKLVELVRNGTALQFIITQTVHAIVGIDPFFAAV